MRATTGRAVSAAIHSRLREALASGKPFTHSQLAEHAGCTVRSVRNYLDRSEEIFGFRVERFRDGGHSVLVHAVGLPDPSEAPVLELADSFATALADAWLPHRSGRPAASQALARVLFACRGIPAFTLHQTRALETWTAACSASPLRPHKLRFAGPDQSLAELACWPVAVVFHSIDGVQFVALPLEAEGIEALRTFDLATVDDAPDALTPLDASDVPEPPIDLAAIDLSAVLAAPFSGRILPDAPAVHVHVRFSAGYANVVQSRLWHHSQRVVVRRDGSVDVRFGPVPLDAAAGWVASMGRAVELIGDKRLRKAVKKRHFESV